MDKFFGGRSDRRRLKRPAWWYVRGCSVPGCTIPLLPAGENLDDVGLDMRVGGDMIEKNISYSQCCFLCRTVLCRYHLTPILDFVARYGQDFIDCFSYTDNARLCHSCLSEVELNFILWQDMRRTHNSDFVSYWFQREMYRRRYEHDEQGGE